MGAGRASPGPNPFSGGDQFGYRTVSPDELEGMFGNRAPFSDFFQQFFGGEPDMATARVAGGAGWPAAARTSRAMPRSASRRRTRARRSPST